jgi:outer membrane murein-binding lipoprotein Lpp
LFHFELLSICRIRAQIHRTDSEIRDLENQISGFQEDNKVDTTAIDHKISVSQATIEETENDIEAQKQSLQAAQEKVVKAEATLRSESKASQPTEDGESLAVRSL